MNAGDGDRNAAGDGTERIEFDYAWGWFQYHASQRLTAFNFFLIIIGLLLVGYAQAIGHDWSGFGFGLGLLGALVAAGFLALDVRNEELVARGLRALEVLEEEMRVELSDCDLERKTLSQAFGKGKFGRWFGRRVDGSVGKDRSWLFRHRFWLRCIIAAVGAGFVFGAAWAGCGYPGADSSATLNCRTSKVLVLHRPGYDLSLVQRSEQERKQGGTDDDRGRPGDGLSGDLHVESVGMGDHKRVETGRHCGKEAVGGG